MAHFSAVWDYFSVAINDDEKAKCKLCPTTIFTTICEHYAGEMT